MRKTGEVAGGNNGAAEVEDIRCGGKFSADGCPEAGGRSADVRLSIVVATYNRPGTLVRTLESLTAQSLPAHLWEAVIVDNNSTDNTGEVFGRFTASRPGTENIRMVFEAEQGLSHARNRGITECRGDIIAIIDDDELVNEDFAAGYLEFFDGHPDAAAAGGKITPLYEAGRPEWMSRYTKVPVAGTLDLSPRVRQFPRGRNPFGGNMAFRRETLNRAGLFDPAYGRSGKALLAGEEKELFERIRRIGGKVYWVPGPEIFHIIGPERLTREYFERLNYMGGVSERTRTLAKSRGKYIVRLFSEGIKWGASLLIAAGYCLTGKAAKAKYLLIMRRCITVGLLKGAKEKP
ncbi:MAG: glycosyltransferase [Rikenellaceae bacterium]|nr:glycosyltransferase [Rikenellaceae bacterium]